LVILALASILLYVAFIFLADSGANALAYGVLLFSVVAACVFITAFAEFVR